MTVLDSEVCLTSPSFLFIATSSLWMITLLLSRQPAIVSHLLQFGGRKVGATDVSTEYRLQTGEMLVSKEEDSFNSRVGCTVVVSFKMYS